MPRTKKNIACAAHANDFVVFSSNKDVRSLLLLPQINVVSIDPAVKNFSMRFEVRTPNIVRTVNMERKKFTSPETVYNEVTNYIDLYSESMNAANVVLIERQMKVNYIMTRVSQHCLTYFTTRYPHLIVIEVNSQLKTRILDAPKKMTKPQRKQWSVDKALELYRKYGDTEGIRIFSTTKGKLDDMADTTTQSQAFFSLVGYSVT